MTTSITFGGRPVCDAIAEAENLAELGYPLPPHFERANSLNNPLGEHPARGWFLMLRQDLNRFNLNSLLTLTMQDDLGTPLTVKNLVVCREPACITPSGDTKDPLACFLVEVADSRYRCHNPYYSIPINAQYNVRAPGWGGEYYAATLNAGSPWTWSGMIGNIWGLLSSQLGVYPGLPAGFTPDGVPERYRFVGVSAWRALCQVLDKLGLAVSWQAASNVYSIVQRGAMDAKTTTILADASSRLLFSRQYPAVVRGRIPAGVSVNFHRVQEHYGSEPATAQDTSQFITNNVYTVQVNAPAGTAVGAEPGTYHPLWDDLPAIYDPAGTLLNASALATRAQNRANAYYASIQGTGGGRRHSVYAGLVNLSPGPTIRGVKWGQDLSQLTAEEEEGGGLLTEIITTPIEQIWVADNGQFEEALEDSSALRPPDLRVKEPVWPDLCQVVNIASSTPNSAGLLPGYVYAWNSDTTSLMQRESCLVLQLPSNDFTSRLVGYNSGQAVYAVANGSFSVSNVVSPPAPTYTNVSRIDADSRGIVTFQSVGTGEVQLVVADANCSQAGVVNNTTQSFLGSKSFGGNVTVGNTCSVAYSDITDYGTTTAYVLIANGTPLGYSNPIVDFTVQSAGGVQFGGFTVSGSYVTGAPGELYIAPNGDLAGGRLSAMTDSEFIVLTYRPGGLGLTTFGIGSGGDFFFNAEFNGVAQPGIYIGADGVMTECSTGTDAVGNIFTSGLNTVIGGTEGPGANYDFGSFWPGE